MTIRPNTPLKKIADGDGLRIAPLRDDGATYGNPTWIWSVEVEGEFFVRVYDGLRSRRYHAALRQRAGRVTASGSALGADFEPAESCPDDRIDTTYRAKYRESLSLESMTSAPACATTMRLIAQRT